MVTALEKLKKFIEDSDLDNIKSQCLHFILTLRKNNIDVDRIKTFHGKAFY